MKKRMPTKAKKGALTPKQERFVHAYIACLNATRAYQAVYGVSERVAASNGERMLRNAEISKRINAALKRSLKKFEISNDRILQELAKAAYANIYDYLTINRVDGTVCVNFSKLTRDQAAAISEIRYEETLPGSTGERKQIRRVRFKLRNKLGALELLGKYLKLFDNTTQPDMPPRAKAVMKKYRNGELEPKEVGAMFAELGEPFPETVKIEQQKVKPEPPPPEAPPALDDAELEAKHRKAMSKVEAEVTYWLPERREEVKKIKDDLKGIDSFAPCEPGEGTVQTPGERSVKSERSN